MLRYVCIFLEKPKRNSDFQRTFPRNREPRNEHFPLIIINFGGLIVCDLNKLQSTTKSQKSQEQYVLMMQTSASR